MNHVEWVRAVGSDPLLVSAQVVVDEYGSENGNPAIVLDTGSSTVIIEGSLVELEDLARHILSMVIEQRQSELNVSTGDVIDITPGMVCLAPGPRGLGCTLPPDHGGDHGGGVFVTETGKQRIVDTWPND